MANKKRGESNADRVQRFFKEHPNRTHRLGNIASSTGLRMDQVRGAISYLNAKAKAGNAISIECVERGTHWRYNAPVANRVRGELRMLTPAEKAKREGDHRITERERQAKATQREFEGKPVGPKDFSRMIDALGHVDNPVPLSDPTITLRVLGTLRETGEVLVGGDNTQGFEKGVWAMRRLY